VAWWTSPVRVRSQLNFLSSYFHPWKKWDLCDCLIRNLPILKFTGFLISGDSTGGYGGAMAPQFFRWPPSFFGSMEFWEMTTCYSNRLRTSWAFVFLLRWYEWELRICASVIVRQQSLHPPVPEVSVLWRKPESKSGRHSIADGSVHTCVHAADRMVSAGGIGLPLGTKEPQGLVQMLERSRCSYAWISCQRIWHEFNGDEKLSFFLHRRHSQTSSFLLWSLLKT